MPIRWHLSVRWHLPLLTLALGLALLAWLAASTQRQAAHERDIAAREPARLARIAAIELDARIGQVAERLALAGQTLGDDGRLPPGWTGVTLWMPDGGLAGEASAGASVAYRGFFSAALAGPGLAVEAPLASAGDGSHAVFALRVDRGGQPVGVVSASLPLGALHDLLPPGDGTVTVTDARGIVLARSGDEAIEHAPVDVRPDRLRAKEGAADAAVAADVLSATAGSRRTGWRVRVSRPVEAQFAQAEAYRRAVLAAGSGVVLLAVLVAAALGTRLAAPFRALQADAARLARGELSHRSRVTGSAEARALAVGLNRMAETLQQRARSLESSEEALADLYENAPFGYYSLDERGRFVRVNDTAVDWLGCPREDLIGGLGITDFMRAEGRAAFARNFPRLADEGFVGNIEFDLVGKAGRVRRVVVSATAVRDAEGRFCLTRTAMHDVTEARAAKLERVAREQPQVA